MDGFLKDISHAFRSLRNSPGFTVAAVAAMALGIGANVAIFSVINTVLLTPLKTPDADRMVVFGVRTDQGSGRAGSPAKFQHWRRQTSVVADVAAMRSGVVNYTGGDIPEQLRSTQASADYFRLFRAPMVLGRGFSEEEDLPNGPRVTLISERLWERRFDRDPDVLGDAVSLSGDAYTFIGVVGDGFDFSDYGTFPQLWTPFQFDPNTSDQGHYFQVMGRLKDGVSLAQARAALEQSTQAYRARFPDVLPEEGVFDVTPTREVLVSNARPSLLVLMGAVGFVLLIACANVANLLLVRATVLKREIALRAALGAGPGRIIRQLLTESVMLSLAGGALGLLLGVAGIRALLTVNTAGLPRIGEEGALVSLDWRVALFALAVSVATGLVFGLLPALRSSRADLSGTLKESADRSGSGLRQNKVRAVLVMTEVALALVLLIGSALFIRTWGNLQAVDPGWNPMNVLSVRMSLTGDSFATSAGVADLVRNGIERLGSVPGIESASATCCVPLEGGFGLPFVIVGRPLDGPSHGGGSWATVSPGFFDVFRISLRSGRVFTDRDRAGAPGVAIINETMAERFWPDGDPLSDRLVIGRGVMQEFADEPERQIVGIVADTRDGRLTVDPGPKMYIPQAQQTDAVNALNASIGPMAWVVRTQTTPQALIPAVEEELRQVSGLPVADARTMDETVLRSTSRQRFNMLLMTVFAGAALLLAAIGVYGLMAYTVELRTQEIGIRLALGAEAGQIRRMVVL